MTEEKGQPLKRIVVGTRNPGKVRELEKLLVSDSISLISLDEFDDVTEVPETGNSFFENAVLKATGYAKETGNWVVADDSGLEVKILGGEPGVFSARYAGLGASDAENIEKLLQKLNSIPDGSRSACFVCEMALCDPDGRLVFAARGSCDGIITRKPRGYRGFGYDPIFVPDGYVQTFGELPEDVKERISHRSSAAQKIVEFLVNEMGPTT